MTYDVARVRGDFPALAGGDARFDSPGGSQVPACVADAVAAAMTAGLGQRGYLTETQRRTDEVTVGARRAVADLLGADPRGVVFGRSMTHLTMDFARTLAHGWGPGDEVVVSRLDHDANIRPWMIAAERVGATVRWLEFDPVTTQPDPIETVLTDRTCLVAITAASNLFGTRPDVPAVVRAAHAVGARVYVDAVHLAPHAPIDLNLLGADFVTCSPYKFFGPHLGVLAADPDLLQTLRPDKLRPSTDAVPERFELGTLPYELLAGTTACVDFLAALAPGEVTTRAERVRASMIAIEQHESLLGAHLRQQLETLHGFHLHGAPPRRTPTFPITSGHHRPEAISAHLADHGVIAPAGHFYAMEAAHHAGLEHGAVRVGLAAYSTFDDVDRLIEALRTIDH